MSVPCVRPLLPGHGCDQEAAPWPGDGSTSASWLSLGPGELPLGAQLLPCPPEFSTSQF